MRLCLCMNIYSCVCDKCPYTLLIYLCASSLPLFNLCVTDHWFGKSADLKEKKFFPGLVAYMHSGPVVCMVWEGRDAVKTGRKMLGEVSLNLQTIYIIYLTMINIPMYSLYNIAVFGFVVANIFFM